MTVSRSSGGLTVLRSESVEVAVLPRHGARIHRLRVDGHDLLRTPADVERHSVDPFFWGAFVMAPWCNRLTAGTVHVGRHQVEVASNFRDESAIHGQVYDRPWRVEGEGEYAVEGGGDGWPWPYRVRLRVAVVDRSVRIEQSLANLSDEEMPGGLGIHPWFPRPVEVAIRARLVYTSNVDFLPKPEPVRGEHDVRTKAPLPNGIDATWTDLSDPAVALAWPRLDLRANIRADAPGLHVVAANAADIDAVAVEPQTHAPHGLRRLLEGEPGGLAVLGPGDTLHLRSELTFETNAPAGAREDHP